MFDRLKKLFPKVPKNSAKLPNLTAAELYALKTNWCGSIVASDITYLETPPTAEIKRILGNRYIEKDQEGYSYEILGCLKGPDGYIGFVESKQKQLGQVTDISIKVVISDLGKNEYSRDIESYNPYFGCSIQTMKWVGDQLLLIYEEKHGSYACICSKDGRYDFFNLRRRWRMSGNLIGYHEWNDEKISVLCLPEMKKMGYISDELAQKTGLLPG